MLEINKVYRFKDEFAKELNLPFNQINRRQEELLEWLKNFYDYEFLPGNPIRIIIREIYGEYQPMPRKFSDLTQEKKEKYTEFTIASLGPEFEPNSQARIARKAIQKFGKSLYSHTNVQAVAKRYIKEPMETYGESDNQNVWVWHSSYEPLGDELLIEWRHILKECKISEEEAADAFYRQESGEDISKEKQYYKNALREFQNRYSDIPVRVSKWRLR